MLRERARGKFFSCSHPCASCGVKGMIKFAAPATVDEPASLGAVERIKDVERIASAACRQRKRATSRAVAVVIGGAVDGALSINYLVQLTRLRGSPSGSGLASATSPFHYSLQRANAGGAKGESFANFVSVDEQPQPLGARHRRAHIASTASAV